MSLPPLVTADRLLDLPGVTDANLAAYAVAAASSAFRAATRNPVSYIEDDVTTLWGDDTKTLTLPCDQVLVSDDHPVSVTVDGVDLDPTDYLCRRTAGVLVHKSGLWCQDSEIQVTYSHGYATIPDDVQDVVLDMARRVYDQRPQGLTSETIGGETYSYAPTVGVTQQWTDVVGNYRLNRGDEA